MAPEINPLVREVIELTGAPSPAWLEDDAPLLGEGATAPAGEADFYMVGLIGGKDVGKSALVNALAGQTLSQRTSFGPGTEIVVAYCHSSIATAITALLEREAPGKYRIVTHDIAELIHQVLLDLPDVDSHYAAHLALTLRMLRLVLFPVWVQSVEKYADRQPQELLARVAAGNAPGNFIFCLNKVDQLDGAGGAMRELQDDYAARLGRVLALSPPPRVWAISALMPQRYELPSLRQMLARQKSGEAISAAKQSALSRQTHSVVAWLDAQDLPGRAQRLARLEAEAQDMIGERIGLPLIEGLLPRLAQDPAQRKAIVEECLTARVSRWPVVNVLHPIYSAISSFIRRNTEARAEVGASQSGESLVDAHLAELAMGRDTQGPSSADKAVAQNRTLGSLVQSTFARLAQMHPVISHLYGERKLWEAMPASLAAAELRDALAWTVDRQRGVARDALVRDGGMFAGFMRGTLTLGALIWFPLLQPVLEELYRRAADPHYDGHGLGGVLLQMLSMANLLDVLGFFLIYYTLIWLFLRWDTQRRVDQQMSQWQKAQVADPSLSLMGRTLDWLGTLLGPIKAAREKIEALATRAKAIAESIPRG